MKLVLVSYERSSAAVRLLSETTFGDRKAALVELERVVAAAGRDDLDLYVVDLESATPVLLLATPSPAGEVAQETAAGAWESPQAEPEARAANVPEVEETIAEAVVAEAAEKGERPPATEVEPAAEKPLAQAGPAITPPSSTDLATSLLAATTALEASGPEGGASPAHSEAAVEELAPEEVCVEPEMIAEAQATDEAGAVEAASAESDEAEIPAGEAPEYLQGGTAQEPLAGTAGIRAVEAGEADGPLPESAMTWPWDKPSSEGETAAPEAVVEGSVDITEAPGSFRVVGQPGPGGDTLSEVPGPDASGDERVYEPGALNMQQYTCADCVYVSTCPNRDQKAPTECGSFQWKSG